VTRRKPLPIPRYTLELASAEIARVLTRFGRGSRKDLAFAIGLDESSFSAKMRGVYTDLNVDEIGRAATYLDAPPGWPWIPWPEEDLLRAVRERTARK
jgi:hypothetical protein